MRPPRDSAMSLDSLLGPTSRPVVTAAGRGHRRSALPALPLNRVSQPFWSRTRQRNGTSIHRRALHERGKLVEAGLRKATIGSLGGGLGTEAALGIEPVTSSLAGASLPPLVLFRIAKKPNTRIATTAIPCRVRRLGVSQGTTKRCCIIEPPVSPWRRAGWEFYSTGA